MQVSNTEYVTYNEIGNIIKEKLFLQNEQHFDTENYYEKLSFKRSQNDLEQMLKGYLTEQKLNDILFKRDIDYVKQEQLVPLKNQIRKINEDVDNNEINQQVKNAEIDDEIKEQKKYLNQQLDIINEKLTEKLHKNDMDFINQENFINLKNQVDKIKKLNLENFYNKYYENTQTLFEKIKSMKNTIEEYKSSSQFEIEKCTQKMQTQIIDYQKNVLNYIKDKKQDKKQVLNNNNFDIEIQNIQQNMDKLNKSLKNVNDFQQNFEQKYTDQINLISQQFNVSLLNNNSQIQNLKQQIQNDKNESEINQNYSDQINEVKLQFFSKTQSLENQLQQMQLKIKQKQKKDVIQNLEQTYPIKKCNDKSIKYEELQNEIQYLKQQMLQTQKIQLQSNQQKVPNKNISTELLLSKISKKADLKKITKILDEKANVDDVNKLLEKIYDEIDKIPQQQNLGNKNKNYHNEILLYWKNNYLTNKKICWTKEVINQDKSNFILSNNKYELIIINEGLYQISFGVFGKFKPKIEMYINNQVIMNTEKISINSHSNSFENIDTNNGNVIGSTYLDYFILPFNARIWFKIECDTKIEYEGFLKIIKN